MTARETAARDTCRENVQSAPPTAIWENCGGSWRAQRGQAGVATGGLLLLLLVAAGLGGWNYHRNWQLEQAAEGPRPYESYAVEDLRALRDAYSTELEGLQARFEEARRSRVRPKGDRGSISENLEQFDRTSRISTRIRDAAADVAARQDQIAELDREIELRARLGRGLEKHIERLVSI